MPNTINSFLLSISWKVKMFEDIQDFQWIEVNFWLDENVSFCVTVL